jgi:RsiW-degrading membrane proteinase PrsW (M82 family)
MVHNWVFVLALTLLVIGEALYVTSLVMQRILYKNKTDLQPLKYLFTVAIGSLIASGLPLMLVYLNILVFHWHAPWLVEVAVLANAASKVIAGVTFVFIYRFKLPESVEDQ